MSISPWMAGATGPTWQLTYTKPAPVYGQPPVAQPLGGAVLGLVIRSSYLGPNDAGYERTGIGVFTITDAINGLATYAPDVADVASPGDYQLIFTATIGGQVLKWPPVRWIVLPA